MTAYELTFSENFSICNFNIMSHKTSKFIIPNDTFIHHEGSGENQNDWTRRYQKCIEILKTIDTDIICLEEATQEFYNMLPVSFNNYYIYFRKDVNLMTLIKKSFCQKEPIELELQQFKYSKLNAFTITTNDTIINIVNVHLIGTPSATIERRNILKYLIENIPNVIVIGDYNESVYDLIDLEFNNFLNDKNFILTNQGNVMTSYSMYIINQGGFVTGTKEFPWENIDNILYPDKFKLAINTISPENGLEGRTVPYKPLGKYIYANNINEWPSDHSLNIYMFSIN